MSRHPQPDSDWTTLGEHVANLHLDLAVQNAESIDEVRTNLEAIGITVATSARVPRDFRRAYDARIKSPFGVSECCVCCTPEALQEYEDYLYRKMHDGFDDEDW